MSSIPWIKKLLSLGVKLYPPKENDNRKVVGMPYISRGDFLTAAERAFYFSLQHALSSKYEIFAKVRIADLIDVPKDVVMAREYLFKITSKHVDFLLCRKSDIKPILAIELDDSSHYRPDRYDRDVFVDAVFKQADFKLLRIMVKRDYNIDTIINDVERALGINQHPF